MRRTFGIAYVDAPPRLAPPRSGSKAICIGLDRTSVPMAEERAAAAPAKPRRKRQKPRKRRAPKPIDVNFRMAYIGTVRVVDDQGDARVTRRYAAPASDNPAQLVAKMTADVRAAVRRMPSLTVGTVRDGATGNLDPDSRRAL